MSLLGLRCSGNSDSCSLATKKDRISPWSEGTCGGGRETCGGGGGETCGGGGGETCGGGGGGEIGGGGGGVV